jgi:hypothetical protein
VKELEKRLNKTANTQSSAGWHEAYGREMSNGKGKAGHQKTKLPDSFYKSYFGVP